MKINKILALISATLIGSLFQPISARAFNITLNNVSGSTYFYDVTLDAGERLEGEEEESNFPDYIQLSNFEGLERTNATEPYATDGSSSTEADFIVPISISSSDSSQTFSNVISLTFTNPVDNINFEASYNGNLEEISGTISTAVPFEFSPTFGLLFLSGLLGIKYLTKEA